MHVLSIEANTEDMMMFTALSCWIITSRSVCVQLQDVTEIFSAHPVPAFSTVNWSLSSIQALRVPAGSVSVCLCVCVCLFVCVCVCV